jgi:hypothetical protein
MASLDRFVKKGHKKNILFVTKRSRLAEEKSLVRLSKQDGRFYHLKAGKKRPRDGHLKAGQSGFRMSTVPD